jgi:hypothetical protein
MPTAPALLFGPYKAPALQKGDRAFCLARDCDVVITSWTYALMRWPRCRALETHGGGSGLLVNEELARAVQHESAIAIKFWWSVSTKTVWWWRQALGVTNQNNEGSRRLVQAAAEAGAAVMAYKGCSDEECEARAIRSNELNLARFLKTGYHGPLWKPEELALLGTMPDADLAARLGKTPTAVRVMRSRLGIANPTTTHWTAEELALLGTMPDAEVAFRPFFIHEGGNLQVGMVVCYAGRRRRGEPSQRSVVP